MVGGRPVDVGRIPGVRRNVRELARRVCGHIRALQPGQHGHELRARHVGRRLEGRGARAGDDARIIELLDVRIAPAAFRHIRKRERRFRRLHGAVGAVDVVHQVAVEQVRLDDALVGDAADELHVVGARDGHDVPDAGLEGNVGIAVIVDPALRAVALEALGGVFVRRGWVEGGDGVHEAVVRQPALIDVDAAGGVLVIVLAHVDGAGHHQRAHAVRWDDRHGGVVVAGERIGRGLVARIGEVIDVRLDLDALVDLERLVDRQVEERVVVVRQKVGFQHAVERLREGFVVVLADAELVELEVVHALER